MRAVQRYAAVAPDGVRHLQCGKLDDAGLPAIIGSVNGFYQVIHRLSHSGAFVAWTIIGDLPAGPRQLAYHWAPYADALIVVVEPSWKSVLTARRIAAVVRSRPRSSVMLVASKVRGRDERAWVEELLGEPTVAAIPMDQSVLSAERAAIAPIDRSPRSPAVAAIERLATMLEELPSAGRQAA